jgi:hypothetical protein
MPNYKRIVPRPTQLDGNSIVRMYVNGDGNLVVVFSGGNIMTVPGIGTGPSPSAGLDGGFADDADHTIEIDAHDAAYVGTESTDSGGAYNSL